MTDEKSSKIKVMLYKLQNNPFAKYCLSVLMFSLIGIIVVSITAAVMIKPVSKVVHKAEAALPMQICDVGKEIDSKQKINPVDAVDVYGEKAAKISCEKAGINCNVYSGLNRASFRNGVGIDKKYGFFGDERPIVVAGYDTTAFSSLKYVEKGDIFTVTADKKTYYYRVKEALFTDNQDFKDEASQERIISQERLVLYSIFSDFSDHYGENFYVVAERVKGAN